MHFYFTFRKRQPTCNPLCSEFFRLPVQPYTGPWSKIRDKNLRMRKIFNSKSPPKMHACADSCRDFLTTDLKFLVHDVVQEQCNSYCFPPQYGFCASKHLPMGPRQAAWNSLYRVCLWVHDKQPGIHCTGFAYGSTTSSLEFTVQGLPMGPRQAAWNSLYRVCLWVHDKQPGIHCTGFAGYLQQNLKSKDPRPFLILVPRTITCRAENNRRPSDKFRTKLLFDRLNLLFVRTDGNLLAHKCPINLKSLSWTSSTALS